MLKFLKILNKIMEIRKILFFMQLFLFFSFSLAPAQGVEAPGWARTLSGWWIFFIALAFTCIVTALIGKWKWVLYLGVVLLYISIILIIVGVILPLFSKPTVTYEECKEMFKPDVSIVTMPGLFYTTSCIFTGYAPQNLEWLTITTFIIFGIIAPLALLISLFFEFMPTFMIRNKNVRRVIAVIGALFAFRGFFATYFIQILDYGFAGIGALMVGTLFTGFVWKTAEKFVSPLGIISIKESAQLMGVGYLAELENREMKLLEALKLFEKDSPQWQKTMEEIEKIRELKKKFEKPEKKL